MRECPGYVVSPGSRTVRRRRVECYPLAAAGPNDRHDRAADTGRRPPFEADRGVFAGGHFYQPHIPPDEALSCAAITPIQI